MKLFQTLLPFTVISCSESKRKGKKNVGLPPPVSQGFHKVRDNIEKLGFEILKR